MLLFYYFTWLCLKLNILLKSSNKFRIFTATISYHLFILKKYLTFPIGNWNKSGDRNVTDYRNIHNPAYVLWTCPLIFETLIRRVFKSCQTSMIELFCKYSKQMKKQLINFAKSSIIDVWQNPTCASVDDLLIFGMVWCCKQFY